MNNTFSIQTIAGSKVILAPSAIEAMATFDWGTSLYMASGTRWDISESVESLIARIEDFARRGAV